MLDMNTVEITKLVAEYARDKILFIILGFSLMLIATFLIFSIDKIFNKLYINRFFDILLSTIVIVCFFCGFNLLMGSYARICEVSIKVMPTEKLTIDQMQKSDKFIKKDGDFYYVKTIKTSAFLSCEDSLFDNFDKKINQIKEEFNYDLNSIYYKSKIINK